MALDSIPEAEKVKGATLLQVPNAMQSQLNFYGNLHLKEEDGYQVWDEDRDHPWISPNSDVDSPEWADAVKVRKALSIAIDRQSLIDNLLLGFGHPNTLQGWGGPDEARYDADMVWEYDPEANVKFQNVPYGTLRPTLVARTYRGATCHAASIRLAPTQGFASYLNASPFSYGAEHDFLEENIAKAKASILRADREAAEDALARWNFDNAFAMIGLYVNDNVWPVGPNIDVNSWKGHVKQGDLRQINGFEYIAPR